MLSTKLIKKAALKIYPDAPHGMAETMRKQINAGPPASIDHSFRRPQ
jgi:hypothetical protein